jgi:glycosyltransferase involved in cell wall biosynthesis
MKICQLCAVDFTFYRFLMPLAEAEIAAGHEVVAVCADGPLVERIRAAGIRVETVGFSRDLVSTDHIVAYQQLVELFRAERFDMVHVHTPVAAFIGRLAAKRADVPQVIYTAHGFYFHERMADLKRWAFMALEWFAGRATHVLFTQAEEDAATARRLGLCKGGVIEAIGNGVDPARFHPPTDDGAERAATRQSLDTPDDAMVVMVIGRLVAEKGYPELFKAVARLNAILWVIGERLPSDHAKGIAREIDAATADPALGPRLRLLGGRDDVPALLRAADIYTLPSHREGMPRSILEAMMSGLPVVATDIRGAREEVVDGETGRLVPATDPAALAEALGALIDDGALRARFGTAGRKRALALYDEKAVIARQLDHLGLAD